MEKYFKFIAAIIIIVFVGAVFIVSKFPNKQERIAVRLNSDLPREIGTVGRLDSITYKSGVLSYNLTVFGDYTTDSLYHVHYNDLREIIMLSVIRMNGQFNRGLKLAELLHYYKEQIRITVTLLNKSSYSWTFTGRELQDFIYRVKMTPIEAMQKIFDIHLLMANMKLPTVIDDDNGYRSISVNNIRNLASRGDVLLAMTHDSCNIQYEYLTPEIDVSLDEFESLNQDEEVLSAFTKELTANPDIHTNMKLLVIAHANLKLKYTSTKRNKTVTVTIPYDILKMYCSVPDIIYE